MFKALRQQFFPRNPTEQAPDFRLPQGERIYSVGDIHGRGMLLQKMLDAIDADMRSSAGMRVTQIFLGDYIDRGMESRQVLAALMQPPTQGAERICLMGNHEAALLAFLKDPMTLREWGSFGGYTTLASYGIGIPTRMTPEALMPIRQQLREALGDGYAFLSSLPTYHVRGNYLFVHAGILPNIALENQSRETMMRIREPFIGHTSYHPYYVVHGHTPVQAPQLLHNRANLDVSEAAVDSLACLVIEGDSRRLIEVNMTR